MAIIFLILLFVAGPHFTVVSTPAFSLASFASFISFGGAVYGFATGWSSYAADYNVNQPEQTSSSRIFWLTFLGVTIPCILLEIFGMALTTVTAYKEKSGGDLLGAVVKPLGGFGSFLLLLLALSIIANNIPNDYSLGLSVQVLGKAFQRVNRAVWTLIGAVIYVILALLLLGNFNTTLDSFLLLVAYWLGPWSIILILEHFVFRHGRYNLEDWNTASKLPIGWAALVSMLIGLFGAFLGAAQVIVIGSKTIPAVGPLANLINPGYGIDIGFELAIVLAAISYLILRRVELRSSGR
jgi:purine-cytosine permease-like protein